MFVAVLGTAVALVSCVQDDISLPPAGNAPEGYVNITFNAAVPDMKRVEVRAVDPDGIDVQNMTLFCFNTYGLFIATANANPVPTSGTTGSFSANVPEETRIIHFIANQNPSLYSDDDFMNKTEAAVMADMEGASGMLIYWARFEASGKGQVFQQELAAKGSIEMIRNQAKISIADWSTEYLNVTGFVTTGIHAFGTVAPHSNEEGFVWPGAEEYVTLPQNTVLMSDIQDVNTKGEEYIFEHENRIDNPISVIIRGNVPGANEQLYYRVALIDAEGEQLLIRRNHSYVLNITGSLTHGRPTFVEALDAPVIRYARVILVLLLAEVGNLEGISLSNASLKTFKYSNKASTTVTYRANTSLAVALDKLDNEKLSTLAALHVYNILDIETEEK